MSRKASCENTDYTKGFRITVKPDGTFVAVRGKKMLTAASAAEINELIQNFKE